MPLSKERKAKYPPDWKDVRQRILAHASYRCELCGVRNHSSIRRYKQTPQLFDYSGQYLECLLETGDYSDEIHIVLTVHHVNDDPTDNRDCNLLALCQRCHNKLDAPFRGRKAAATRKRRPDGQKPIFD